MNCEKCLDKGFIEENHGLIVILCDCERGKEYRTQREAILGIPGEIDDSGTEPNNTDSGESDTSEPKQPKKQTKKKRSKKRHRKAV